VRSFRIQQLDSAIDTSAFHCGQPALDDYLKRYASQDIRRNLARVFVAVTDDHESRLAGFFTLSAGSVNCTDRPDQIARKLPRYPVPVALLGRLSVDKEFQGSGLGSILLADVCQKVIQASSVLAVAGIVVDAKDTAARNFYEHFGFLPFPGQPLRLLLPTKLLLSLA
jgi:GNAT superfamily N-acetyltransferase